MRIGRFTGSLFKAILLVACVIGVVNWQSNEPDESDVTDFATKACVDEIDGRYNVSNAKAYDIDRNSTGYVVRVSVTPPRGSPAKVICLTNAHGGIREIIVDDR